MDMNRLSIYIAAHHQLHRSFALHIARTRIQEHFGHHNVAIMSAARTTDALDAAVFHRLHRLYQTFNIIAAALGSLSLFILAIDELQHDCSSTLHYAAAGLLTSAFHTAVTTISVTTMLLFWFDSSDTPTLKQRTMSWVPVALVDIVIMEVLIGVTLRAANKYDARLAMVIIVEMAIMLAIMVLLAVWIWDSLDDKRDEIEPPSKTYKLETAINEVKPEKAGYSYYDI